MHRWLKSIFAVGRPLAAMLCVVGFFTLLDFVLHGSEATFWSKQNLQSISVQNAFVAICSIGMLLVIISGGIDLSAGVALALSSTILAWGIREDVGFILSRGENVAGAVARLKTAENSLHDAKAHNQPDQLEQANTEVDLRRRRLIELLQMKRSQLDSVAQLNESHVSSIDEKLADVTKAISDLQNPNNSIDADPAWLRSLPNAASSTWLALIMGVGTGALCGLANGILIVVLRGAIHRHLGHHDDLFGFGNDRGRRNIGPAIGNANSRLVRRAFRGSTQSRLVAGVERGVADARFVGADGVSAALFRVWPACICHRIE